MAKTPGQAVTGPVAPELRPRTASAGEHHSRGADLPAVLQLEGKRAALGTDGGDVRIDQDRDVQLFQLVTQDVEHRGGLVRARVDFPVLLGSAGNAQMLEEHQRVAHGKLVEHGGDDCAIPAVEM